MLAIGGGEALGDGEAVPVDFERLLQVPERQVGFAELVQHHRAAALQVGVVGRGGRELLERCLGGLEDLAHRFGAHALHVAQPLGDVEHQAFGGLLRELEVARGAVALLLGARLVLLRDPALLDRDAALPIRKSGEPERQHQAGGETAGDDVPPPRRRLPALADIRLRLVGRRRRASRPRGDPALRLLQRGRAQQQSARPAWPTPSAAPARRTRCAA